MVTAGGLGSSHHAVQKYAKHFARVITSATSTVGDTMRFIVHICNKYSGGHNEILSFTCATSMYSGGHTEIYLSHLPRCSYLVYHRYIPVLCICIYVSKCPEFQSFAYFCFNLTMAC